jgi:predicted nucleotidyltransferase
MSHQESSRLERIAQILSAAGVRFIVIGGQAEYLFGSPRVTYDVDLCYLRTKENLERLASALAQLNVTLRGAPADVPYKLDVRALSMGLNFTLNTSQGDLDLLGYVEPLGDFARLDIHATDIALEDFLLRVISLDDLIKIKQHINRPKDRDSLFQLLAIKRLREETGQS